MFIIVNPRIFEDQIMKEAKLTKDEINRLKLLEANLLVIPHITKDNKDIKDLVLDVIRTFAKSHKEIIFKLKGTNTYKELEHEHELSLSDYEQFEYIIEDTKETIH